MMLQCKNSIGNSIQIAFQGTRIHYKKKEKISLKFVIFISCTIPPKKTKEKIVFNSNQGTIPTKLLPSFLMIKKECMLLLLNK